MICLLCPLKVSLLIAGNDEAADYRTLGFQSERRPVRTNPPSRGASAIWYSLTLNNRLALITEEKRVRRYGSAVENEYCRTCCIRNSSPGVSNVASARHPRFSSIRRLYSVDETGGVPLSMKV